MGQVKIETKDKIQTVNALTNTVIKKGYSPYVDEDTGTWWEYDDDNKKYVDTEITAAGADGDAATIEVGTVTSGTTASVTNVGTSSAAVFDFVVPKGETGPTGPQGPQGVAGRNGTDGSDADVTHDNVVNALGYTPADEEDVESISKDLANEQTARSEADEALNKAITDAVEALKKAITLKQDTLTDEQKQAIADLHSDTVKDVQIGGTSILDNDVANIPLSGTTGLAGVVRVLNSYGLNNYGDGNLGLVRFSDTDLKKRSAYDLKPILLGNMDKTIKASLSDGNTLVTWTADEQKAAKTTLGFGGFELIESATLSTDVNSISLELPSKYSDFMFILDSHDDKTLIGWTDEFFVNNDGIGYALAGQVYCITAFFGANIPSTIILNDSSTYDYGGKTITGRATSQKLYTDISDPANLKIITSNPSTYPIKSGVTYSLYGRKG